MEGHTGTYVPSSGVRGGTSPGGENIERIRESGVTGKGPAVATERAATILGAGEALVDEVYDLACWLGPRPEDASAIVRSAFCEVASDRHMRMRAPAAIETEVLVTAATRSVASRPDFWFRSPPRLDPGSLHPSAAVLAPAGDVSRFVRVGRTALALLPPDDAAFVGLSVRYELTPDDFASALGMSQRRAAEVIRRARRGFVGCAGAVLLWADGTPECTDLVEILDLTGIGELRQSAASLVLHHGRTCPPCRSSLWRIAEVAAALQSAQPEAAPVALVAELAPLVRALAGPRPLSMAGALERAAAVAAVPHIERAAPLLDPVPASADDTAGASPRPRGRRLRLRRGRGTA